ncbi:MAG: hypothetical protein DRP59_02360 [Spirochaetes bacterium]|nr:MAG: hypothetical protein DRP59_02360 [Spirochaetota bacterium]
MECRYWILTRKFFFVVQCTALRDLLQEQDTRAWPDRGLVILPAGRSLPLWFPAAGSMVQSLWYFLFPCAKLKP